MRPYKLGYVPSQDKCNLSKLWHVHTGMCEYDHSKQWLTAPPNWSIQYKGCTNKENIRMDKERYDSGC